MQNPHGRDCLPREGGAPQRSGIALLPFCPRAEETGSSGATHERFSPSRAESVLAGPREGERLPARAAHPHVLARLGHLREALADGGEDVAGYPALVTVDEQIVAAVEDGEVDDRGG